MTKPIDIFNDPAKINKLTKAQLVELNDTTEHLLEELGEQRVVVRERLLEKIEGDGEIIGDKTYGKMKIYNFDVDIKKARELGAVKTVPAKETIDNAILKKMVLNGIKIKHEIVERLMIREVKK